MPRYQYAATPPITLEEWQYAFAHEPGCHHPAPAAMANKAIEWTQLSDDTIATLAADSIEDDVATIIDSKE